MHTPPNGVSVLPLITPVTTPVLARPAGSDLIDGRAGAAWPAGARATASPAASDRPAKAHVSLPAVPARNVKDVCRIGARLLILPVARSRS
jgi:hypothetical protein